MLAGGERHRRLRAADLRRGAQRHGIDGRTFAQQLVKRRHVRHTGERSVAAGNGGQLHALRRGDRRYVLVTRDLAEADDGDAKRTHDFSPDSTGAEVAGEAAVATGATPSWRRSPLWITSAIATVAASAS